MQKKYHVDLDDKDVLEDRKDAIRETLELVRVSEELLQEKLHAIEKKYETVPGQKMKWMHETEAVYLQFKQSMQIINTCIDMIEDGVVE